MPVVTVDRDNVRIDRSCVVEIPDGAVIADADNNGVIQITRSGITVRFADGSVLRGAAEGTPWDTLTGTGIVIEGQGGVTLENARVHGYRVGLFATDADGLTISGGDYSDNYRKHLGSTPEAEDGSDWLSPHRNDNNEWLKNYAAAVYIEESANVTVRGVRIRRGQNGILLDEVNDSKVYDNDASFLSGWGLALWRSSRNVITRNHFDFCVRGHVEGVYNRGQDSAGMLFFEQCNENVVAENSATHGGDCIFAFAGLDALGDPSVASRTADHKRKGCNDNLFIHNDLSYAPAHGWEMTFSFGNKVIANRFVENAICGIWGGFSQDTLIAGNLFDGNGGMGYGLERGGVNIEHSAGHEIVDNRFVNNLAGVHIWWDDPGNIVTLPWGKANYRKVTHNTIAGNEFDINDEPRPFWGGRESQPRVAIQLREDQPGNFSDTRIFGNEFKLDGHLPKRMDRTESIEITESGEVPEWKIPDYPVYGDTRPVEIRDGIPYSDRVDLRGRDKIIMNEWGPWDHETPLVRLREKSAGEHVYDALGFNEGDPPQINIEGAESSVANVDGGVQVRVTAPEGIHPYTMNIHSGAFNQAIEGTLLKARWLGRVFSWAGQVDPRENADEWYKLARRGEAIPFGLETVSLDFGYGGPKDLVRAGVIEDRIGNGDNIERSAITGDHFGLEIAGRLPIKPGRYRLKAVSDDGLRVWISINGAEPTMILDEWRHQVPTPFSADFTVDEPGLMSLRAMYFEIDGYAKLDLALEQVQD
ncbi:MAG: right-handed parallel beta-helix repeat-containing protein [Phycisphaeraceae bacterium]|nr:MAG: right-handed parallel beta-helix repeat-containing protein [Phycisphaeraceae bacterium]